MTPKQRYKEKVKERIRVSNEREANGLLPDPWVVAYRKKNNKVKKGWFDKNPEKWAEKLKSDSAKKKALPKKDRPVPHNKLFGIEKEVSIIRARDRAMEWRKNNREEINRKKRERRQNDIGFRIACNLRKRLSFLVRKASISKTEQTLDLLGCPMPDFLEYLKSKFSNGMSFENYGEWHLDHILPCDMFDLTIRGDRERCFHYTNLQPLWASENRIKSNKLILI